VLRGDGLTTTSLEVLTGQPIQTRVVDHYSVGVPAPEHSALSTSCALPAGLGDPGIDGAVDLGTAHLGACPGQVLLVRQVLLVDASGTAHAAAEIVALQHELPEAVVRTLATTNHPIGRLLRDHDFPVIRELRQWGLLPAGPSAGALHPVLAPNTRIPGRRYIMRRASSGVPVVVLTEHFAPELFDERSSSRRLSTG
jgi:chorismate-pyruvate lyase